MKLTITFKKFELKYYLLLFFATKVHFLSKDLIKTTQNSKYNTT